MSQESVEVVQRPVTKLSHVDLVVTSLERSLHFYRGLLAPIGWTGLKEISGERGEPIWYLSALGSGVAAIGLRQKQSDAHPVPYDRFAVGVHHVCIDVPSRDVVDERAQWLVEQGAVTEVSPREYEYKPGYYPAFFFDPDGIKLELLHRPSYLDGASAPAHPKSTE
jgi:catechol 2,3-dioxygenase-like lactoylglutathione lyase family enzyme